MRRFCDGRPLAGARAPAAAARMAGRSKPALGPGSRAGDRGHHRPRAGDPAHTAAGLGAAADPRAARDRRSLRHHAQPRRRPGATPGAAPWARDGDRVPRRRRHRRGVGLSLRSPDLLGRPQVRRRLPAHRARPEERPRPPRTPREALPHRPLGLGEHAEDPRGVRPRGASRRRHRQAPAQRR